MCYGWRRANFLVGGDIGLPGGVGNLGYCYAGTYFSFLVRGNYRHPYAPVIAALYGALRSEDTLSDLTTLANAAM